MNKILISKNQFSHDILQVQLSLVYPYDECKIQDVKFFEYDITTGEYDEVPEDSVSCLQKHRPDRDEPALYYVNLTSVNGSQNHLIKAIIKIKPDGNMQPCCIEIVQEGDEMYWLDTEYFIDLTVYEKTMLDSLNLKCNECDVPLGNINSLLKLFALKSAVVSQSPLLESLFSKIACGRTTNVVNPAAHHKCNCNG